ncbi:GNAT family N-acetyltransferase [Rhizobium sp. 2YAF20]
MTIASRKPEAGVEKRLSPDPRLVYVLPDVSVLYGVGGGEKNMTTEGSMRLQSFDLRLFDIADTDLEKLHALSLTVGWPHRLKDWEMLRESGYGIVAQDEIGRVFGSAMWFPFADDFTTVGMVITSPRLQAHGHGRWLMEHVLKQTGSRPLRLNSTRAAYRLYLSMGFTAEKTVYQHQGTAVPLVEPEVPHGAVLREISVGDLSELVALDRIAYGTDRQALFARLLQVSTGVALIRDKRIAAFSLCRSFGRGTVIGPVVASDDADAIAVIHPHVVAHAGDFLRLDTRQKVGPFAQFLTRSGMPVFDTVTSMSLGGTWFTDGEVQKPGYPLTYALVSQALS